MGELDINDTLRTDGLDAVRERHDRASKYKGCNTTIERLILPSADFVAGFTPPEYVIEGILQRRFLYSLTGQTGSGKTAMLLTIAAHVALGRPIGDRAVEKGRVIYLAGENHTDVQMRWLATADRLDLDLGDIDVGFVIGAQKISETKERLAAEIAGTGEATLVIIDTSAAFFEGDNENDNFQAGAHARLLRSLTDLPGGPCILVACHPTKNAGADNLLPRGGGAFLAEVDGNLTALKNDSVVELHHQGKFRGPDFAPLSFQLRTVTHPELIDSKGRRIPTVVAQELSHAGMEQMAKVRRSDEDRLLKAVADHPLASFAELASILGWHMREGRPYKMRVKRILKTLEEAKLIKRERDRTVLTPAGRKAIGRPENP